MTGIDSYSTTALTNETFDGTSTWKEGQLPSTVNNSARQVLADLRARFNDLPWFQYGNGDQDTSTHLAKPCVYSSATAFTVAGNGDQTAYYHAGRPIRAVGSTTGTIYGVIASSSYSAGNDTNTVNVTWASGSLSSETLVISAGLPVTGYPAGRQKIYLPIYIQGKPSAGETYPIVNIPVACSLPASLTDSIATIETNPTATMTFTLNKNGVAIGTIAFSTGGTPTLTAASKTSFAVSDQISMDAPAVQDDTGAYIAITLTFDVT